MGSLLSIRALSKPKILDLVDAAETFADKVESGSRHFDALRGRLVTTAFFEPSTRTRLSFEAAARFLGADVLDLAPDVSSSVKGESLEDTARTIDAIGSDLIVVRHSEDEAPEVVDRVTSALVVSGGAGTTEHPTQTLLDLLTIRRRFGDVGGLRVAIVGDIVNSRVAAGLLHALPLLGAEVVLVGPRPFLPRAPGFESSDDLDHILESVDIAYVLRIQTERGSKTGYRTRGEYHERFGMTVARLGRMPSRSVVMHPGPMNRGVEIADELADHPRCLARAQVANGVPTRMAVLARCFEEAM